MSKPKIKKIKAFDGYVIWRCGMSFFEYGYGLSPVKSYKHFLHVNKGRDF